MFRRWSRCCRWAAPRAWRGCCSAPGAAATYAFRELTAAQWRWVLDFVTRGGAALHAYPQYHRVVERDGVLRVRDRRIATRHRMHVGTITSDAAMRVCWLRGGTLGHVEESLVARLKPGERSFSRDDCCNWCACAT